MVYLEEAKKILASMSLSEKIGQMNLGLVTKDNYSEMLEAIGQGKYGAYLSYEDINDDPEIHKKLMDASRSSSSGIPVLYGKDVIHGHWTVFPIGLGMAASFNPQIVEEACELTAYEANSEGIFWTFSPMMDIARDPRWGRIAEGFGEDPYLASRMAEAAVWGFQGRNPDDLKNPGRILSCPKHFIGYGACEGGRDANTVEISQNTLLNIYFPPFLAAMKAGAGSIMSGYHDLNGEPVSASHYILTTLAKQMGGLDGFIVSDYATTSYLCQYRYAEDKKQAVALAANTGLDMDMCSFCFEEYLEDLVREGIVSEERIDDAVLRILSVKLRLDLWKREVGALGNKSLFKLSEDSFELAVEAARQASVLLVNKESTLPLSKAVKKLYVAGPFAKATKDLFGCWCLDGVEHVVTPLYEVLKNKLTDVELKLGEDGFSDRASANSLFYDTVLYLAGESSDRSGERNNISHLGLPEGQEEQIISFTNQGKKVILVVIAGRPLSLARILPYVSAVLYVFHPGTGGAEAVARILTGEAEPGGRLPVTIPRSEGQIPLYYNSIQTRKDRPAHLRYLDMSEKPLFSFGYGLTYTTFDITDIKIDRSEIAKDESIRSTVQVRNTGDRTGEAVVQCYIQDCVSSPLRPVQELKGFKRVMLEPSESKEVEFILGPEELGFFNCEGDWIVEPGRFMIFIGLDAEHTVKAEFAVVKG